MARYNGKCAEYSIYIIPVNYEDLDLLCKI